ncbi:MAG: hypothetical protein AAGB31_11260 [Bdellovibrio sp.]
MKSLIAFLALSMSHSAYAKVDLRASTVQVQKIAQMEKDGATEMAFYEAVSEATRLHSDLKLDQVWISVSSRIQSIDQEVKVKTVKQGLMVSLLGLFSFNGKNSYDVTKIVSANPAEVVAMEHSSQSDFSQLQTELSTYFQKNELPVFYAKVLTAKALQLASKLPAEGMQKQAPLVRALYQKMSALVVSGVQSVTRCHTTNYIAGKSSTSADIDFLFGSLDFSTSTAKLPYSKTSCKSASNHLQASEKNPFLARLAVADDLMESSAKAFELSLIATLHAPYYPTWGLPSYQ